MMAVPSTRNMAAQNARRSLRHGDRCTDSRPSDDAGSCARDVPLGAPRRGRSAHIRCVRYVLGL